MDTTRLTRVTVAGWAFVLAWPVQLWILGFNFHSLAEDITRIQSLPGAAAAILVGVAAGPVLGFVLSTFSYAFMKFYRGGEPEFDLPSRGDFKKYSEALKRLITAQDLEEVISQIDTDPPTWKTRHSRKERIDRLIPFLNLCIHSKAPPTFIEYASRRWTVYWMSINSVVGLAIGSLFGLFTAGEFWNRPFVSILDLRYLVEFILLLFLCLAIRRLIDIPREIFQIAWDWVYAEANKEKREPAT